ncbi:NUDIX hydrolase [Deinococcus humi]
MPPTPQPVVGRLTLPGGGVEPGETPKEAAGREIRPKLLHAPCHHPDRR